MASKRTYETNCSNVYGYNNYHFILLITFKQNKYTPHLWITWVEALYQVSDRPHPICDTL